jgi:hypothetical protein
VNLFRRFPNPLVGCGLLLLAGALGGCRREEIQVYQVPKETAAADPAAAMDPAATPGADHPSLTWTLPAGWTERAADQMRVASFAAQGEDGQEADVGVIALPGVADKEGQIINMWREQVKLPAAPEEELASGAQAVQIGSKAGKLYDVVGTQPMIDGKYPGRILVGMLTEGDTSWFFKMAGPVALVEHERPAFLQFLKSVSLVNGKVPPPNIARQFNTNAKENPQAGPGPGAGPDASLPDWKPPANWQALPGSPMLRAHFLVPGAGDARAEVNISAMGGMGGGTLANVNRWRGQLGLEPVDDAGLEQLASPLDVPGSKAVLVDLSGTDKRSGQPARLVAVIVPQGQDTWFYKLMGEGTVVEKEKAGFIQFVRTARYPDAP